MKNILIVDDEPHVTLLLKQFLERSGYGIKTALNGEQALACINEQIPDVLITDVQMPKINGMELCETIEKQFPGNSILILLMTSRTDQEIRVWAEQQGQIVLLEKPLSMRRLASKLSQHFEAKDH